MCENERGSGARPSVYERICRELKRDPGALSAFQNLATAGRTEAKLRQDKGIRDEYQYMCDVLDGKRQNDAIQDALLAMRLLIGACSGGAPDSRGGGA